MESLPNNSVIHPRAYLYKIKDNKLSQHERRIKYLQEQKEKRHVQTDRTRDLCDIFIEEIEENKEMECETTPSQKETYRFKLMLTEWFTDIPDDLEENWLVKFAPEGFRILLITRNHHTNIYTVKGKYLFRIKSNFPGGGGCQDSGTTVLDCIYNSKNHTIFILDCLFWNSMSTLDSEATFRFYWLTSKFQENPDLAQYLKYKFVLMESVPAAKPLIQEKMFDVIKMEGNIILYDGIAFYHKESHYTFGYTPLTTWLASYMLPEKLCIDVPEIYLGKKPKGYLDFQHFIQNEALFKKKRKYKKPNLEELMDV